MHNLCLAVLFNKKLIITVLLISLILSCIPKEETLIDLEVSSPEEDLYSGQYFNSSKDHLIKSIDITYENSKYCVSLHTFEGVKTYSGVLLDNEIVFKEDDHTTFHLYLNVEELRVYKVVERGYQPEDIEWTFYSIK